MTWVHFISLPIVKYLSDSGQSCCLPPTGLAATPAADQRQRSHSENCGLWERLWAPLRYHHGGGQQRWRWKGSCMQNCCNLFFCVLNPPPRSFVAGIVVEDCLLLLLNLLKNNSSNQNFFKEGSYIQRMKPWFEVGDDNSGWSAQKVTNLHLMLQVAPMSSEEFWMNSYCSAETMS